MPFWKKISPRRIQVRRSISADRFSRISRLLDTDSLISILLWILFVILCVPILTFDLIKQVQYNYLKLIFTSIIVVLICLAIAFYIHHYQKRIIINHTRALALVGLFTLLLVTTKCIALLFDHTSGATGCAVTAAIILTIAYNQRFAIGMIMFYCLLGTFAAGSFQKYQLTDINLFLTMMAGGITCCLSLREIRTRMKLLQVSALSAALVFITAGSLASLDFLAGKLTLPDIFRNAGYHAGSTFLVGLLIQSLLPLIEKAFRIATSMTLLDFSDANQPLLKKLAMEAPGTFSHSLLIGSVAEAAAEAINRNGLLCRVGAYYHDIGKINKANYFIENDMGSANRHKELSPTMSQLIIVGHVKDGIELAREYNLPNVLRQFIETHHGTTLIEHFYNEAKKLTIKNSRGKPVDEPSESEFRYPGPKPRTKEAAIVMLADTIEGAVRSLPEVTPTKVEAVVHTMSMRRLQDGQFDECDLSLRELSQIETSISKTLAAHHHGRIAYPKPPDQPDPVESQAGQFR
ncbi:MAG: HDIG domain-containing protein [Sedimentisphaerales bacterium]|nr:HDIG domain-containing protein [Sedimentisphaerales bacterium]